MVQRFFFANNEAGCREPGEATQGSPIKFDSRIPFAQAIRSRHHEEVPPCQVVLLVASPQVRACALTATVISRLPRTLSSF